MIQRLTWAGRWLQATFARRDVLFGLATLAAVWGAMPTLNEALTPPDFSRYWRKDCDIVLMRQSLLAHPRPRDTLQWLTGTWVGKVPFWRPLTSWLFWAEWKLFGWENQDAWMLVHFLSWLAACWSLFFLAEAALGSSAAAAATVTIYSFPGPGVYSYQLWTTTAGEALTHWKNSVDLWLTAVVAAAALAAWRERWGMAIALAAAGCAIKETGFAAMALLTVAAAARRRFGAAAISAACLSALAACKLHFVGPGFVMGTNRSLAVRMVRQLTPYPIATLLIAVRPFGLLGFALAALVLLPRLLRGIVAGALVCGAVASVCVAGRSGGLPVDPFSAVLLFFDWRFFTVSVPVAAWIIVARWGISWPTIIAAAAWWVLSVPATLAPQVRPHALAPANAFGALAIVSAWRLAIHRLGPRIACWFASAIGRQGVQ